MKREGKGFYDLSVIVESKNKNQLSEMLSTFAELGYNTVALNQVVEESAFESSKKKRKGVKDACDPIPPPIELSSFSKELKNQLRILNRITVYFSETVTAHKMVNSENFKKYDIHAIIPMSSAALQHTCKSMNIDIISMDVCNKSSIRWNRKLYDSAVDRGIWFELPYANSVLDANARKILISTSHSYHAYGRSKNIIISSGAQTSMQARGPYDVISLGLLLGLSEEQAKSALTHAGRSVVLQAESRRRGKAVILMELIEPNESTESEDPQPQKKKIRIEKV